MDQNADLPSTDGETRSGTRPTAPRKRSLASRLSFLIGGVLAGLLLAEGAVRIVDLVTGSSHALQLEAHFDKEVLFQPHPYVGWILTPGFESGPDSFEQYSVNSLGFRGRDFRPAKPARTFRVACLGGSTTYGGGASDDAHTWPALLEKLLNALLPEGSPYNRVEVINAGVPGYTSMESFVNFKMRVMPLEPDLIILYHGINDSRVMGMPGFRSDYSHVRMPWTVPMPSAWDMALGWSHLYGLLRGEGAVASLDDIVAKPYVNERLTGDELVPGLVTWRRTLTELTSMARGNGCTVMLTTFAYTRQHNIRKEWMLTSGFEIVDAMNEVTKAVAAELDTLFADLSKVVGTRKDLFTDPVHLSDLGNQRIAMAVSREIAESGVLAGEQP